MEIFDGHRALFRPLARPAVALGNFDGFHVGHRELVARARDAAGSRDGDVVVYTFEPHPAQVLAPARAPKLLTTLERRLELFGDAGVTVAIIEPFTPELARLEPGAFEDILLELLGARTIVVGYDFTYGRERAGTVDTLRAWGRDADVEVEVVDPVEVDGAAASSTRARALITAGELPAAARVLGRPHDVDGVVVKGAGRGRTIGVPTANVATSAEVLPPNGVYAVRLRCLDDADGRALPGAANLGVNPTFQSQGARSLEVHVLDFDGNLYDRPVRVEWVERIRDEQRFDGPEQLVAQIRADIATARQRLA